MIYLQLFYEFFKTGLLAVGGGLATLPFLNAMAENHGWFTVEDVSTMIAVAESTPGAIGVNMATYAGFITGGVLGAVVAVAALTAPAIIIIMLVAKFIDQFKTSPLMQNAFSGLRPASMALIAMAGLGVAIPTFFDTAAMQAGNWSAAFLWKAMILAVAIFLGQKFLKKIHPTVFILIAAVAGIVLKL
ncbi:MAG: chromate transporter [Clostridia bacterium]|nr:chromate transporter [Clostridia bacterium]